MRYNVETLKCDNCGKESSTPPNTDNWIGMGFVDRTGWFKLVWEVGETKYVKDLCCYQCLVQFCSRDISGPVDAAEEDINLQNNADFDQQRLNWQ